MGHSSITTTREFYVQVADANERAAVDLYERVLAQHAGEGAVGGETDARLTPTPISE